MLAIIYTSSSYTVGTPKLPGLGAQRFSDAFNMLDSEFIELMDADIQPLADSGVAEAAKGYAIVRRRDALVVVPQDESISGMPRLGVVLPRIVVPIALSVTPYRITGKAHLPPGVDLPELIHDYRTRFIAITDATVTLQVNPAKNFEAPFLLVNREMIDTAGIPQQYEDPAKSAAPEAPPAAPKVNDWVTQEWTGKGVSTDPPAQPPEFERNQTAKRPQPAPIRGDSISDEDVAQALAGFPIFENVRLDRLKLALQAISTQGLLYPNKRIRTLQLAAGDELFATGSMAEGIYFVASGMFRAVAIRSDAQVGPNLGYLGPGDVIGEMAVLGDGYHTATVLAESEAAVIIIPIEALNILMNRIPSITRRLLGIMYRRIAANASRHTV